VSDINLVVAAIEECVADASIPSKEN